MTRLDKRSAEAARYRKLYKLKRWRDLRASVLGATPLCTRCRALGRTSLATVVHHRLPHKGSEALFWARENLEAVCKPCHDGPIQESEAKGFTTEIGADGLPIDPSHPARR